MRFEELTFPLDLEKFITYQGERTGRELLESEREALSAWLPIINGSYQDGVDGEDNTESMAAMAQIIDRHPDNEIMSRFLNGCRAWMLHAWEQGCIDAGRSIE